MKRLKKVENELDILFICNSLDLGGAEKIMYELIKNLKNYKIEIICLKETGFYSNLLEKEGIKITYCNLNKDIFDLIKLIKTFIYTLKKKPKIIHSFLYHSLVIASILGKLNFNNQILWSIHHDFVKSDNTILRNIQVKFLAIISNYIPKKIIYCSEESQKNHEYIGYCKRKSILIENGICTKRFYPRKYNYHKIRKLLHLKKDSFLIGHIGRFHPDKGHSILLNCLKLLKEKYKNFKCLMIGTDINKKNILLNEQIKKNNLQDHIILYGETKFPHKLINAFDINVISSLTESASLVLLEGMSSGVPTLATNVGPIMKIIDNTGWVIKSKSSKDLAEKLIFIIKNRSFLKEKSVLSRELIIKKFSQEKMLEKYYLTYKSYL